MNGSGLEDWVLFLIIDKVRGRKAINIATVCFRVMPFSGLALSPVWI